MESRDWYTRTYRQSPLPQPVAEANRLRYYEELGRDYGVDSDLLAQLGELTATAVRSPAEARDRWQAWADRKRAEVRATLGEMRRVRVLKAERQTPILADRVGLTERYRLWVVKEGEGAEEASTVRVAKLVETLAAKPQVALVVLPELEPSLGLASPPSALKWIRLLSTPAGTLEPGLPSSSSTKWVSVLGRSVAVVEAEFACLDEASATCGKRLLVQGSTFLGQLVSELQCLSQWLREGCGFSAIVVVGCGHSGLVAMLAAALLPEVSACVVADGPTEALWPTDIMFLLPGSRRTMTGNVLAALIPPRGLLALEEGRHRNSLDAAVQMAQWSADLLTLGSGEGENLPIQACSIHAQDRIRSWFEAIAAGACSQMAAVDKVGDETCTFPNVVKARAASSLRERFVAALGGFPEASEMVAWSEPLPHETLRMEQVFYRSEPDVVVPGIFAAPANADGPLPVVLCLPGSSSRPEDVIIAWGMPLIECGFAVFAVDVKASRFGKRVEEAAAEATARGQTTLGQMTWDLIRALDYLATRPDVDMERIGCFGISIGGTQTWMLAAVDERVKVSAPVVGVASYESIIRNVRDEAYDGTYLSSLDGHTIYYYVPGLLQLGDQKEFVSLIAPRPLSILAMSRDNCFPRDGIVEAVEYLRGVYDQTGVADRFECIIGEGPHSYPPLLREGVREWMRKWL